MADIKFSIRKRKKAKQEFWSVEYNDKGNITKISPGVQADNPSSLSVSYSKIQNILSGAESQSNYIVTINEKIGALDLVDRRSISEYKVSENNYNQWHSISLYEESENPELKFVLFPDKGIIRLEPNRIWTTRAMENRQSEPLKIYITDSTDPHILLGNIDIKLQPLLEKGYSEFSLWDLINPLVLSLIHI